MPLTSQQALQRAISAMRGHFHGRLGHAQATCDFTYVIPELQRLDRFTLPRWK